MNITVLSQSLVKLGIIDVFESMIWTDRYYEFGDFELYTEVTLDLLSLLQEDNYVQIEDSNETMIIESVEIKTTVDAGNKLVIKGRSLSSLLERRIVLRQVIIDSAFQAGIQALLNSEVINGDFPERNFENFYFYVGNDPLIAAMTLKAQYYMDNVYDVIKLVCENAKVGFRVVINELNQFIFYLHAGADRSYNQIVNPYVVFSPTFENLIKSEYFRSKRYKKNFAFVAGEDGLNSWNHGIYGRWAQVWLPETPITGIHRREMFLNFDGIPKNYENSVEEIPDEEYSAQLAQRGLEELAENSDFTLFSGEIDTTRNYKYGIDFFLGDIVQLEDIYGHTSRVRVTEMTYSENLSGRSSNPTLKSV